MDAPPILPGFQGVPYRGMIPDLKTEDPDHIQPQIGQKVHIEVLDLSKDPDLERYRIVSQMVANGFAVISKEDVRFVEESKNWRVFIRWLELFAYDPSKGLKNERDR
jgi:hypothetical protein